MNSFPVSFPMTGRRVVIVGGGEEARRKARLFAKTPAKIDVYAPEFGAEFVAEFDGRVEFHNHYPSYADFDGAVLAVFAIEDVDRVQMLTRMAKTAGCSINVVDQPDLCDWHTPSIIDRGDVVIGISTGGTAPVIGRRIRQQIETLLPRGIGRLAATAGRLRDTVNARLEGKSARSFWERALTGAAADFADKGDVPGTEAAILAELNEKDVPGVVHLVGAGPGDPDLLTIKALRVLQAADIVFYDALVGDGVLDLIRRDADRVFVGKRKSNHAVPQPEIAVRLADAARAGKRVVRLKGGDPFIFGRGGEELQQLINEGIDAQVIPGISSALGCAASIGVPLTHRDHAQSVTFVTGHAKSGAPDLDWAALARTNQTVVVFMGVGTSASVSQQLIAAGRSPETPIAVVENGTLDTEIVVRGNLGEMQSLIEHHGIVGPALLIIGEVAALGYEHNKDLSAILEFAA